MEKRIYYHDTDAGGVVYYANYLKYLEEARTEFFESKGLTVKTFQLRGFLYAVRDCSITYHSPARYGDTIICETNLIKVTAVKIIFEQKIFDKETRQSLIEAQVTLVSLNKEFKPEPIPENIREKMLI